MIDLLFKLDKNTLEVVRYEYLDQLEVFDSYLNFLEENQLGFYCDSKTRAAFLPAQIYWEIPADISNAIIDHDEFSCHNYELIIRALNSVNCKAIELRFFSEMLLEDTEAILQYFEKCCVEVIHLTLGVGDGFEKDDLLKLMYKYHKLSKINVGNSIEALVEQTEYGTIVLFDQKIDSEKCCGVVSQKNMCVNFGTVSEGEKYNTCLNKKLAFDKRGEIKNCPSMRKSFGNINRADIKNIIAREDFRELWSVTKNKIETCKSCEFRKVCIDCRAHLSRPNDILSKPLMCGYDPQTGVWEDWRKGSFAKMAIKHYMI